MFVPMREEVTRGWRKLHNELHNLYSSQNSVRMKRGGACSKHGTAYIILAGYPKQKRQYA
jgi:hypothetical protein